jgi:4-hydroxy-tetrahydrodipicolinate reductase
LERINVFVSGASGKMGREVVRAVLADKELNLVGAADINFLGSDAGLLAGLNPVGIEVTQLTAEVLKSSEAQVLIDFTNPQSVNRNTRIALENGVCSVIGTTGLSDDEIEEISTERFLVSSLRSTSSSAAYIIPRVSFIMSPPPFLHILLMVSAVHSPGTEPPPHSCL